jgi:hypothetical protein
MILQTWTRTRFLLALSLRNDGNHANRWDTPLFQPWTMLMRRITRKKVGTMSVATFHRRGEPRQPNTIHHRVQFKGGEQTEQESDRGHSSVTGIVRQIQIFEIKAEFPLPSMRSFGSSLTPNSFVSARRAHLCASLSMTYNRGCQPRQRGRHAISILRRSRSEEKTFRSEQDLTTHVHQSRAREQQQDSDFGICFPGWRRRRSNLVDYERIAGWWLVRSKKSKDPLKQHQRQRQQRHDCLLSK